jgi:hypothetical protein
MTMLFCASHTVRGTCTFGFTKRSGAASTFTLAEGVYWTDPLTPLPSSSTTPDLMSRIAYEMGVADGATTYAYTLATLSTPIYRASWFDFTGGATSSAFTPSTANAEGKLIYKRLGVHPFSSTALSGGYSSGPIHGHWGPSTRLERTASMAGARNQIANVNRGFNGTAWTHSVGQPIQSRSIRFELVDRTFIRNEGNVFNQGTSSDTDFTLETLLWQYLARGEMVRVYSDISGSTNYLTSSVTASSTTFPVNTGTGFINGGQYWLDGEPFYVLGGGGTATLTVERTAPVAHLKGSPLCTTHVGTYVLDVDGGTASIKLLDAVRRSDTAPQYDVTIPLVETLWE